MFLPEMFGSRRLYSSSLLGALRRGGRLAADVDDQVHWSPERRGDVTRFFDSISAGDDFGVRTALARLVETNRAAKNASGVAVWEHPPLPDGVAESLMDRIAKIPDRIREVALTELIEKFEPSLRPAVSHQLSPALYRSQLGDKPPSDDCVECSERRPRNGSVLSYLGTNPPPAEAPSLSIAIGMGSRPIAHTRGLLWDDERRAEVQSSRNSSSVEADLPPPDPERALKNDPPISVPKPYAEPPLVLEPLNGQVCVRGRCHYARDRNETDIGVPPDVRIFEDRLIRKLYGPNATRLGMKKNADDYHAYRNSTRFCARGRSLKDAQLALRTWAAPQSSYDRPDRGGPVKNGDRSDLCVRPQIRLLPRSIDPRLPQCVPGGTVVHYVDEATGAIANVTTDNHVLHPGYIVRWIEPLPNGCFVIHTLGRGLGQLPRYNESYGAGMFTDLDDAIVASLGGSVID